MSVKEQQARRKELHTLTTPKLMKLYVSLSGRLMSEAQRMFVGLDDDGRQIMIDSIMKREDAR